METLFSYLLKANTVLTVLITVYYIFLRKEKFLHINRFILLGIFIATFTLPLYPAMSYQQESTEQSNNIMDQFSQLREKKIIYNNQLQKANPILTINVKDLQHIVTKTYLLVAFVLFSRLLFQLLQIFRIIRYSTKQKFYGIVHCTSTENIAPFSFFRFIVIHNNTLEPEVYRQVIVHEQAHCQQWHSIDVLMAELACIFLWINPLVFLYRRQIKLNIEFLADEQVIHSGENRKNYQLNLLRNVIKFSAYGLANSFSSSKIKHRVAMMNTEQPPVQCKYKYALLIPLILVLYLLVTPPQAKSFTHKSNMISGNSLEVDNPINSNGAFYKEKNGSLKSENKRLITATSTIQTLSINKLTGLKVDNPVSDQGSLFKIMIDARTDTVKIRLSTDKVMQANRFKGIYVIEDKIYTDEELRKSLEPTLKMDIILPRRPMIGFYTPNDNNAIKTWGKQAQKGVFFVITRKDTTTIEP